MSHFFDDFFASKTVFLKIITQGGLELIVLNPFLDSLCNSALKKIGLAPEAFFSRLQNRGGQNLAGCGNFSTACSFYCTSCSFYRTADARSDSENLQKFLKKWLFWTYLVPIISKPTYVVIFHSSLLSGFFQKIDF